jgi:hypothetical protein
VRYDFRLDAAARPQEEGEADNRQCTRVTGSRLCRPMRDGALRTLVLSGS